jgi:hypothetical protein
MDSTLYEKDILLWVEDTVSKLKKHDFENLDIKNLIEEVESLGISQKKELMSRLMVLLEHLLKRLYVDSPYDYNGWERTIRNQRAEIDLLISQVQRRPQQHGIQSYHQLCSGDCSSYRGIGSHKCTRVPDFQLAHFVYLWVPCSHQELGNSSA